MKARSLSQNTILHTLLGKAQLSDKKEKTELVRKFTNGRTDSSAAMSFEECQQLIDHLGQQLGQPVAPPAPKEDEAADRQRRKIISLAHEMRWQVEGTGKADMARINNWCVKYGKGHKKLNDYTAKELPVLVTQFRRVHKSFMDEFNKANK